MYQRIFILRRSSEVMYNITVKCCNFETKEECLAFEWPEKFKPFIEEVTEDLNLFKLSQMLLYSLRQDGIDPEEYGEDDSEFSLHDITWETGVTGEQLTDCMHLLVKYKFMVQKSAETYMLV